jgi:hypothetical protein
VLAHTGGWQQWNQVEELLCGTDVYLDCAFCADYLPAGQFERIVKKHGADKILFASDSPWEDPRRTIEWIESTGLSQDEKERIYAGNAARLLGLS